MRSSIWLLLPCRLALSIPHRIYSFIYQANEIARSKLTNDVKAELLALVALLPLVYVDLDAHWHE